MQLKGKTALISGAGRNNGKAIALTFAREGADVILVARQRGESLNEVAAECESYGVKALPVLADVGDPAEVRRVVQLGMERFGKVDILTLVAAIRPMKSFWEYDYDEWLRIFSVNVHSAFYLAKALAPSMMERRSGSIIALGAVASLTALPSIAVEVSCKHSLYGLIKAIALELGPYNVRANMIALANIENQRMNPEWFLPTTSGDPHAAQMARTPLGRKGKNQEVANIALFLASDESSYVTGDRIVCAGGMYM